MNWYKKAQSLIFWHISNEKFRSFDTNKMAQGLIWLAKDKEDLLNNLHGASINMSSKPVYLYKCSVDLGKIANREDYDKYALYQLEGMGYNTIDLEDDVAVLTPENVTILSVERIK
jgi:hypothetical protein